MEHFLITVNGWTPLTIITKRSILDVAAALDRPLRLFTQIPHQPVDTAVVVKWAWQGQISPRPKTIEKNCASFRILEFFNTSIFKLWTDFRCESISSILSAFPYVYDISIAIFGHLTLWAILKSALSCRMHFFCTRLNKICDVLRDLVPLVQFQKHERHAWRSATSLKLQAFGRQLY